MMQLKQSRFFGSEKDYSYYISVLKKNGLNERLGGFDSQCRISAHGKEVGAPSA
jgi:hypothetical protein